jgi:hypothetical protein
VLSRNIMKRNIGLILIALLVACNLASLAYFWWQQSRPKHGLPPPADTRRPREYLVEVLNLDSAQQAGYQTLIADHRSQTAVMRLALAKAKDSFFAALKTPDATDGELVARYAPVTLAQQNLDMLTFRHFAQLRLMCSPKQQLKFDSVIVEALGLMGKLSGAGSGQIAPPPPHRSAALPPHDGPNDRKPKKQIDRHELPPPGNHHDGPPGHHPPPHGGPPPPGGPHKDGRRPPGPPPYGPPRDTLPH